MLEAGLDRRSLYPPAVGLHILKSCEELDLSELVAKFPVLAPLAGVQLPKAQQKKPPTVKQLVQEAKERKLRAEAASSPPAAKRPKPPRPRVECQELYEDIGLIAKRHKYD